MNQRHFFFVIIRKLNTFFALFRAVQVRHQQFALDPVFLHALAAEQRLLLQRELALEALDVRLEYAMHRRALLLNARGEIA